MRIRLVHWKAAEGEEAAAGLRRAGFAVDYGVMGPELLRSIRSRPPDAFVIDLTRVPSHGREAARAFRLGKATRHVPIVFAGGAAEKVGPIRETFPDAAFCTWGRVPAAVRKAVARPVASPVVPRSDSGPYSGVPLVKKLGVREGSVVGLSGAPEGFEAALEPLPPGARVRRSLRGACDLALLFARSSAALRSRFDAAAEAADGAVWIVWPKRASGLRTDLDQHVVQAAGLSWGLVDFKICAVDETWSGMRFARRRAAAKGGKR